MGRNTFIVNELIHQKILYIVIGGKGICEGFHQSNGDIFTGGIFFRMKVHCSILCIAVQIRLYGADIGIIPFVHIHIGKGGCISVGDGKVCNTGQHFGVFTALNVGIGQKGAVAVTADDTAVCHLVDIVCRHMAFNIRKGRRESQRGDRNQKDDDQQTGNCFLFHKFYLLL